MEFVNRDGAIRILRLLLYNPKTRARGRFVYLEYRKNKTKGRARREEKEIGRVHDSPLSISSMLVRRWVTGHYSTTTSFLSGRALIPRLGCVQVPKIHTRPPSPLGSRTFSCISVGEEDGRQRVKALMGFYLRGSCFG